MELEEILPLEPEFTLKKTGKTHVLRLVSLEDQTWIKEKFGDKIEFERIMKSFDWSKSIQLIYRLLIDKSDFLGGDEEYIDDEGRKVVSFISGPTKLLRAISGMEEGVAVMAALAQSIMKANPMLTDAVKAELQKELDDVKKKIDLTGQKSSTSSQTSTDGQSVQ